MSERIPKRGVVLELPNGGPERLRSLLVPLDLAPSSDRALGRVQLLPLAETARITLLHVIPAGLLPPEQLSAQRAAQKALAIETRHLRQSLPKSVSVEPVVEVGAAFKEISACARATKADLIVMGRGSGRAVRDTFLGSTAERVIRRSRLPVLVARTPARTAYRRPALALDFDEVAEEAVRALLRVVGAPRTRIAIIHAFSPPYQGLAYSNLPADELELRKTEYRGRAARKLEKLLASALKRAKLPPDTGPHWKYYIRYGSPRLVIEKMARSAEADLLVLGTHGYAGLAHVFLGTVAGDVLRRVACDVLIVPPRSATRK